MSIAAKVAEAIEHWDHVSALLAPPETENEYSDLVEALDTVLDAGGADEFHPLATLAYHLGDLIDAWEEAHVAEPQTTGVEALKYLMAEHGLRQSDLPEVGSQGVVSEILAGKRELNLRQLRSLAHRFGVAEQVFI